MTIPIEHEREFARFSEALRELVAAEIAAGNGIAELSHGFPAAPCGAYIVLMGPVTTRARRSTAEVSFYDRNNSTYSGEFTDALRHFFVLEPPRPQEPPPDMDAIRAAMAAREAGANCERELPVERSRVERQLHEPSSVVARFIASMEIDYEKWREGTSYDLDLIRKASDSERQAIESILIQRGNRDWRDVEALAAIDSPNAQEAIKRALHSEDGQVQMAVHRFAPKLMTERERIESLVRVLERCGFYEGLTQALLEVEAFHPPEIMSALWRGLKGSDGGVACHFAAMLAFLHGKSASPFDWDHRPFFLRFNTPDMMEREKALRALREWLGVEPGDC